MGGAEVSVASLTVWAPKCNQVTVAKKGAEETEKKRECSEEGLHPGNIQIL